MISLALAGCAHIHTPNFVKKLKARSAVRVTRVWDADPARAAKNASELRAALANDPAELWRDPEIAGVIICSETDRHRELVLAAAAAGKHLFVEKPLGLHRADALEMAAAIERAGVIFQTGYFSRGMPAILHLREQIAAGTFGRITRARGSNCHGGAINGWFDTEWRWMADPARAGCGAFGDLGTHSLDILIWLLGEVESVVATLSTGTARYGACDETGEALLRFKSGAIATLAAAWDDVANPIQYHISGTEASAVIAGWKLYLTAPKLGFDGKEPLRDDQLPTAWPHAFDLFLDALSDKQVPLVSAREAAYRNTVMDALYESAMSKKWIDVSAP